MAVSSPVLTEKVKGKPNREKGVVSPLPGAPPSQTEVLDFFRSISPGLPNIEFCIQCGSCGGSCPAGALMDHTPRKLFGLIKAGELEEVLRSNTPWYCVSCYFCMVRCPQEIHITDIMYGIKTLAVQRGYTRKNTAADLSRTFAGFIENFGKSFDLGIAANHYLRHPPKDLVETAKVGSGLLFRNRLRLTPNKIKGLPQLKKIIKRAKQLEARL